MCTILFLQGPPGHFILAGNRDEMRTRKRARPPIITEHGDIQLLYPVDADAGGTWMGVNNAGVAATLLNNYQDAATFTPSDPVATRGTLVQQVLRHDTLAHAREEILSQAEQFPHIRPFILTAAQLDEEGLLQGWIVRWDGEQVHEMPFAPPQLIISSSVKLPEATTTRTEQLQDTQWSDNIQSIIDAFAQDNQGNPDFSTVCMAREDARTVSHTAISVSPTDISLTYIDGPPNHTGAIRHKRNMAR